MCVEATTRHGMVANTIIPTNNMLMSSCVLPHLTKIKTSMCLYAAMPPTYPVSRKGRKANMSEYIVLTATLQKICICCRYATTSSVLQAPSLLWLQCITTSHFIGYLTPRLPSLSTDSIVFSRISYEDISNKIDPNANLAELTVYIPPQMINIDIIWRFSVYIFRQIDSFSHRRRRN